MELLYGSVRIGGCVGRREAGVSRELLARVVAFGRACPEEQAAVEGCGVLVMWSVAARFAQ